MRFLRAFILGFGQFTERTFNFSDGINVIYGPNESGKSTLRAFIRSMLFGQKKFGLTRAKKDNNHNRYDPWLGRAYGGTLEYEADGKTCRVERDFAADATTVYVDGQVATQDFSMDSRHEYDFAEQHWGVNEHVFDNTVCVRQNKVTLADNLAESVSERLVNFATGGDEDLSVVTALSSLDEAAAKIGSDRATGRPYYQTKERIRKLEEDLLSAQAAAEIGLRQQTEIIGLEAEERELVTEQERLGKNEAAVRLQLILQLEERLKEASQPEKELSQYAHFPTDKRDELTRLVEQEQHQTAQAEELRLTLLDKEKVLASQQRELKFKDDLLKIGKYGAEELEELWRNGRDISEKIRDINKEVDEIEEKLTTEQTGPITLKERERVDAIEAEIAALRDSNTINEHQVAQAEFNRLSNWVKLCIGAFVVSLILTFTLVGFIGLVLFGVLTIYLWDRSRKQAVVVAEKEDKISEENRRKEKLRQEQFQLFDKVLVNSYQEYQAKWWKHNSSIEVLRDRQKELYSKCDSLKEEREFLHEDIQRIFRKVGKQGGINNASVEELLTDIARAEKLLETAIATEREVKQFTEQSARVQAALEEIIAKKQAILTDGNVETYDEFMEICRRLDSEREAVSRIEANQDKLASLLAGGEREDLVKLSRCVTLSPDEITEEHLLKTQQETEQIAQRLMDKRLQLSRLRGELAGGRAGKTSVLDLTEQLAAAKLKFRRLQQKRQALQTAAEMLRDLMEYRRRNFTPHLNAQVSKIMQEITDGRYSNVRIDTNLGVEVEDSETHRFVPLHWLSVGTIDQFYLAMRLVIAEMMSGRGDLPLVLDDIFGFYSTDRLQNMLAYLAKEAGKRQILLFTCQERELDLLRELQAPVNLIDLTT